MKINRPITLIVVFIVDEWFIPMYQLFKSGAGEIIATVLKVVEISFYNLCSLVPTQISSKQSEFEIESSSTGV